MAEQVRRQVCKKQQVRRRDSLGAPRAAARLALHAHNSSKDDAAHLSAYSFINPGGGAYIWRARSVRASQKAR